MSTITWELQIATAKLAQLCQSSLYHKVELRQFVFRRHVPLIETMLKILPAIMDEARRISGNQTEIIRGEQIESTHCVEEHLSRLRQGCIAVVQFRADLEVEHAGFYAGVKDLWDKTDILVADLKSARRQPDESL